MTLRSYVRVRVRVRVRVSLTLSLTLTKPCSNKIGTFLLNNKMGRLFKKWWDFLQFFRLNICLFLKIELLRTFPTNSSYSLAFQKKISLQPSTSFLPQWWLVGIYGAILLEPQCICFRMTQKFKGQLNFGF